MPPTRPTLLRRVAPAIAIALAAAVPWFWRSRSSKPVPAEPPAPQPAVVQESSPRARPARSAEANAPGRPQPQRTLRYLLLRLPKITESDDRPPVLPPEVQRLLEEVTREDPTLALRIVGAAAPDALTRYALATVVARVWGATNPREAWNWASTAGAAWNLPEQCSLHAAVWDGMAVSAPELVIETATSVLSAIAPTGNHGRENFAREAASALVAAGAQAAAQRAVTQWCGWFPDERLLSGAIAVVTASVAATSPAAAVQWLDTLAPSRARNDALAVVAAKWAEAAPESAMAWAGSLPRGEARASALQGAFTAWQCTDLVGCVGWLAANESDPACDPLIVTLVSNRRFRAENPRAAVELASAITDPTARTGVLSSAIESWAAKDAPAARKYLSATRRLSAAEKAAILQAVARQSEFSHY